MRRLYIFLFLLLMVELAQAQISYGGKPFSFGNSELKTGIDYKIMPEVDVEKLLFEDALDESNPDIPWRFGFDMPVNYSLENSGTWESLPNGDRLWRLEIISYGAMSINLIFSKYHMPDGASLFVYNKQKTHVLGSFNMNNHNPDGGFATAPTIGESCILEYYEPATGLGRGMLEVSYVIHGYKDIYSNTDKGFGSSGACNVNVNCPEGDDWQNEKRGVAMILLANNARKCTGSLINNTAQDGTPYFLTASHCQGGENTWIIMFNYESPGCENVDGPTNQSVQYTTLRASNVASDVCLIELSQVPPVEYNVYYNGWNRSDNPFINTTCIHHPSGDIKKITFDYDTCVSDQYYGNQGVENSHWRINVWDLGTTEPGSSGSPLFNSQKQIIGQLHGGYASCTSLTADWFGKFSTSWDYTPTPNYSLSSWLDPLNSGVTSLEGMDPGLSSFANNASIPFAIEPINQYAGPSTVRPTFVIRNMGNNPLTTLNVKYKIDEGEFIETTWTGNLATYDTAQVKFPAIEITYGQFTFLAVSSMPNGQPDEFPENDTLSINVSVDLDYDIELTEIISPNGINCNGDTLDTKFIIKNIGFESVSNIVAMVKIDNQIPEIIELDGSLAPGALRYVVLDPIGLDAQWHSLSIAVNVEGLNDQNPSNNSSTVFFNSYGNNIRLSITTDNNGSETSWKLSSTEGELISSGSNYPSNVNTKESFCLASGCYKFTMYDSGGNGIQNAEGFSLENLNTQMLLYQATTFGDSLTTYFCISHELSCNFALESVNACTNSDVAYINKSTAADYYSWFFEGGFPVASNLASPVIQYRNPGVFDVKLIAWQGNTQIEALKEDYITVVTCSGTEEVTHKNFSIYPNPTTGRFSVKMEPGTPFTEVSIYGLPGNLIFSQSLEPYGTTNFELDLAPGIYTVEFKSGQLTEQQLLMINK